MKIYLDNVGIIKDSLIDLEGLTVITGLNNAGKTTVGRVLYAIYNSIEDIETRNYNDKMAFGQKAITVLFHSYELKHIKDSIMYSAQVEGRPAEELIKGTVLELIGNNTPRFASLIELEAYLKEVKQKFEYLTSQEFIQKINNDQISKQISVFAEKTSFVYSTQIDSAIKILSIDTNLNQYTKDWITKSLGYEMCNQLQPIRLDNVKSRITITENGEQFVNINVSDVNHYVVECNRFYNTITNVYLLDNIMDMDYSTSFINENFPLYIAKSKDEENIPDEFYNLLNSRSAVSHNRKNHMALVSSLKRSVIEELEINDKTKDIKMAINEIIPGSFSLSNEGFYYVLNNKKLNVKNLASGSKVFSILKILLEKGLLHEGSLLILDEPECHLHPEWQRKFAEIICLMIRDLHIKVLLSTHNPIFLLAMDTFSMKYGIKEHAHFYQSVSEDGYMVKMELFDDRINDVYSAMAEPFLQLDAEREELLDKNEY